MFASSIAISAFCQQFAVYNYSVAEGIPSAETYEIFQDSQGFIWFGTDNGVCRFDGKNLEVFNVKDGLSDPVVFGISEDYKGRIWFRTYSGNISYFENGKFHNYQHNHHLAAICKHRIMTSLYCDSLDQIWFGAAAILGKIDKYGNMDTTTVKRHVFEVQEVEDKKIIGYFGPTENINRFRFRNKYFSLTQADTIQSYQVICTETWNNKLYFSVNNSVFEFDGKKVKRVFNSKTPIISMYRDAQNNLWLGYMNNGAQRFRNNFQTTDLRLFKDLSISKILQDHEGGFWFSTLTTGIHYVPNLTIRNFIPLSYSKIKAIESTGNRIITGDYTGIVKIYDSHNGRITHTIKLPDPIIALLVTHNGDLWVSTTSQILIYDSSFQLKTSLKGSRVDLQEMQDGRIMGITGTNIFLYNKEGEMLTFYRVENFLRSVVRDDSLFFFTLRAGFQVRDYDLNILHEFSDFKNLKVSQLLRLNDSTLVVCTVGNGFMTINKNNWMVKDFNKDGSLSENNYYTALVTDSLFWFATEKGLGVTNVKSVNNGITHIRYLTKKSGLTSNKVDFLAKGYDRLWAFTEEGISMVPYEHATFANQNPRFVFSNIIVNDQSVSPEKNLKKSLTFKHDENNVRFQYRFISFNNPNIALRYRLSADDPWIYNDNTAPLFPALAPGKYRFELQYSADGIRWTEALPPYGINIQTPWWNLLYVQLLALFLLIALATWYIKYQRSVFTQKNHYLRIINEHQQKLIQSEIVTRERERNRISKELHDRVGTNLSAIKLTVNQLLKNYNEPMADDIEEQFQKAIQEIKDIIYGLTPPGLERYGLFTGLKNFVGKLNKTIPIRISLKTFGKDLQSYEINILTFRIVQELISNSIKHSYAKNITVHINSFDDVLNIVYEDDGIGFSYNPEQGGLGLDNIESRIQSVNGSLKFESGSFGISYEIDIPLNFNKQIA